MVNLDSVLCFAFILYFILLSEMHHCTFVLLIEAVVSDLNILGPWVPNAHTLGQVAHAPVENTNLILKLYFDMWAHWRMYLFVCPTFVF